MLSDKELKKKYGKEYSLNPDKYYPTRFIKSLKFVRGKCVKCGKNYWSKNERKVCGDPSCHGEYGFINNTPVKKKLDYAGVWKSFSKHMQKHGYTPIKRYPVVARWRDDIPFVEASIDDFIPYVVNGVVKPPANPLTVPQFCLRFNDISNVGLTGAHNTGFIMIGQHRFEKPENYEPNKYLEHLFTWFTKELGIPDQELILHEDVWAGSGNFGPCIEIFSRGVELANQVYMQFTQTRNGYKDLELKVLDMGMGQERVTWFANGTPQSYETTFPTVIKKIRQKTGLKTDEKIIKEFMPFSGKLNADETTDLEKEWRKIAGKTGRTVQELKQNVLPLQAIYSIADHTRSLLVAISDGALPSNTGGGYNLRVIFRRCMDFIKKYGWSLDLAEVCEWHVQDLKKMFPDIGDNLEDVKKIINVEKQKYEKTLRQIKEILKTISGKLDEKQIIDLYDSHGINPETLLEKKLIQKIPDRFFEKVAEKHARTEKKEDEAKHELKTQKTEKLYYDDYAKTSFQAKVIDSIEDYVILDKTVFYPTSGGQIHDKGMINGQPVTEVKEQDGVVLHKIRGEKPGKGTVVKGEIDWNRRKQLAQHHTAVHVVNGSARQVLGNHVWQAGADKNEARARIDITHYESLNPKQVSEIEKLANDVIRKGLQVHSEFLNKDVAEKKYGFRLYQGGAIPGSKIRVVRINDFDVEACAGTHVKNTKEIGGIKITGTKRIQDGVIRIEIKAGKALEEEANKNKVIADQVCELLGTSYDQMPGKTLELFNAWKNKRKKKPFSFKKVKTGKGSGEKLAENLERAAQNLKVLPEHLPNTVKRFIKDLNNSEEE